MERRSPWLLLCRVARVARPGAHADAEEHATVREAEEDAPQTQEEEHAAAVDMEAQAQNRHAQAQHAAVGEADEDAPRAQEEEHAAAVDIEVQAQHRRAAVGEANEDPQAQHAVVREADEDPQAAPSPTTTWPSSWRRPARAGKRASAAWNAQALLEESVVNVNTDVAASEAAHGAAAEADFIISVAPPLRVSSLTAGPSSHPDPGRPDMYPYIIATGRFCLLANFAIEPSYGTKFGEVPNHHSHLVVVRHFGRRADGQIAGCAVRVPDRPKNMLNFTNLNSIGLVCNNETGDYKIAELVIPSGRRLRPFFLRFSSDLGVWQRYTLPCPLDADDDRREWVPHGTISINSKVLWFDLSWGIISCDLAQPPALQMFEFHRLPRGRLLRDGATPDIHNHRCIAVSENLVRFVEIVLDPHQGAKLSMWHQDQDVHHKPRGWIANYEERFEEIWENDSYIQTGLRRNTPMLVGVCPVNSDVIYFSLDHRLFGVNVPEHRVVDCEDYVPLKRPGLPDEPITSRYLITWNLDADEAVNVGHQPDKHSDHAPSQPSSQSRATSLPRRCTQAPSPLSSPPLQGHDTSSLPSVSAFASSGKETPYFDIYLDDIANSLAKSLEGIKGFFHSILKDGLANGKLVTKAWGCFMIRIFSSTKSAENPICALYRTDDLYLDSVLSDKIWYRFKDHKAILPPEVKSEGSVTLDFHSNYESLECDPDEINQIMIGFSKVVSHIETLQELAFNCNPKIQKVKEAFVLLILFMEALRFPEFEKWLLIWVSREKCEYIPLELTELFRKWGKLSIVYHAGSHEFNNAPKIVKKYCKTYEAVCALLGIVNMINLRKQTKATKGKKKKKSSWNAEEADSSSDNKRVKMKMR